MPEYVSPGINIYVMQLWLNGTKICLSYQIIAVLSLNFDTECPLARIVHNIQYSAYGRDTVTYR